MPERKMEDVLGSPDPHTGLGPLDHGPDPSCAGRVVETKRENVAGKDLVLYECHDALDGPDGEPIEGTGCLRSWWGEVGG